MRRSILAVAALLLALAFAGISFADPAWVGKPSPEFDVQDTQGNPYKLGDLKGKVVWINFWGLRCGPCVRELPALEALHEKYSEKGLIILGINADGVDGDFINKSFSERDDLKNAGVTFPLVPDVDFAMIDAFELMGAPLNVIIDRAGIVQFHHEGYESGDEAHYEEVVVNLLAQ